MIVVLQCRLHDIAARENLRKRVAATVRRTCGADCRVVLVPPKTLKFTSSGKLSRSAVKQDYISGEICDLNLAHSEVDEPRSEEHTSELQSLMRISYAVFCLKKKNHNCNHYTALII